MKYRIACTENRYSMGVDSANSTHIVIEAESDDTAIEIYSKAASTHRFEGCLAAYTDFREMVRIDQEEVVSRII